MTKRAIAFTLAVLAGLVVQATGCTTDRVGPTMPANSDRPTISTNEACALVYSYLEVKINAATVRTYRASTLEWLSQARPQFSATYLGKGQWQVKAVGNAGKGSYGQLSRSWGLWNIYEYSGTVEPANREATELLNYIRWMTR